MKGIFLDFLLPLGHQDFSSSLINMLSSFSEVHVYTQKGYYKSTSDYNKNVRFVEEERLKSKTGSLMSRISSIMIMFRSAGFFNKGNYEYCIISSFDTITFAIGYFFFRNKKNMYIVHHNNVDGLSNFIKMAFFRLYMGNVNHIVLDEFIKDHLTSKIGVKSEKVYVIHHPVYNDVTTSGKCNYVCCGISNSNDERIVLEILEKEKKYSVLKNSKCKVVLKSKTTEFDNGYLKLVTGYLDKIEYERYMNESRIILLPFPSSYLYRMSGVLIDAISKRKHVIGSNIPIIRYYQNKYPSLCSVFSNKSEFLDLLENVKEISNDEYSHFMLKHSQENITKELKKILMR